MTSRDGNPRRGVTRDVDPAVLDDLRQQPPRATVAFVDRDQVEVLPVRARYAGDTYRFGIFPQAATDLGNREVVLVIDDGQSWFELRGISVRGRARRIDRAASGETDALAWYLVEPRRIHAWDYGALREV